MDRTELEAVFAGDEPLQNPANEERFRTLLGLGTGTKPFECVGDTDECRGALVLAAQRQDRAGERTPDQAAGRTGRRRTRRPHRAAAAPRHPPHP